MQEMSNAGREHGHKQRIIRETMTWKIWKESCRALNNEEHPKPKVVLWTTTRLAEETWTTRQMSVEFVTVRRSNQQEHAWRKPTN